MMKYNQRHDGMDGRDHGPFKLRLRLVPALTGDIHVNWVNDLRLDSQNPNSPRVGTELVGTTMTCRDGRILNLFRYTVLDEIQLIHEQSEACNAINAI